MHRVYFVLGILAAGALLLLAQSGRYVEPPPYEVKLVFPREVLPGRYEQVRTSDLQNLANDGWELVSVSTYILMNEERGTETPKVVVTQGYPAYYFKRLKMATGR